MELKKQLQDAKLKTHRQQIQQTVTHTEKKIDELVDGFYCTIEEKINLLEGELTLY